MAIKYPENYLTIRWQRQSSKLISSELAGMLQLEQDGTKDANIASQAELLEIELRMTTAHELYFQQQYAQAIDEYKAAQGFIYRLIEPSFHHGWSKRGDVVFSCDAALFKPLLTASLELVEATSPHMAEGEFGPAFSEVPQNALAPLATYTRLGVQLANPALRSARYDSQLAADYVGRGQWKRAEFFYNRAGRTLSAANIPEAHIAKAAVDLSLAGVYVQMGRTANARALLDTASDVYGAANDLVGQAQVSINMAAALARDGSHDEAAAQLQQAEKLLSQAQGLPPATQPTANQLATGGTGGIVGHITPNLATIMAARPDLATMASRLEAHIMSQQPTALNNLTEANGMAVTYRQPGKGGWSQQEVETKAEAAEKAYGKALGLGIGNREVSIQWQAGDVVPADQVITQVYGARANAVALNEVNWAHVVPTDLAVQLPHYYYYAIPVALGDCYYALGEHDTAETYYLQAADYQYINIKIELPALWQKLVQNVLDWGDDLYKAEDLQAALAIYRKVMEPPGSAAVVWAASPLYSHAKLQLVGNTVRQMLTNYPAGGVGNLNPALATIVLTIRARLLQINGGLDFLGLPLDIVPIWSFEFLQNVAHYYAQQAIQAEREFINWWDRGENAALTKQQLQQAVTLTNAEKDLATKQYDAAVSEAAAYDQSLKLANLRAQNAAANATAYSQMADERIGLNGAIAWYTSQNNWELKNTIAGEGGDSGRYVHEVVAERTERLQTITRDYEIGSLDRQTAEMQKAAAVAQAQLNTANARVAAADQMCKVADARITAAQENLKTFNNQFFTPDVWFQMGWFMRMISETYKTWAIKMARLMQRAYNFENDLDRHVIKTDYSTNTVKGLLGADALLLDIDSFTYDLVTTIKRKQMPIKHTISLVERYPFFFETQFRKAGKMEFETRIEDFDLAFPGTYAWRIERVEVEVEGILPPRGVKGRLTNGGISRYRTETVNTIKFRIQPRETLVLSEYRLKEDSLVFPADSKTLKIFEGAGVCGTWTLEFPKAANDVDYRYITDIRFTFYYQARYDEKLAADVKAYLATLNAINTHSRHIPLRWSYPDAYFHFQDTGKLEFTLDPSDFPYNELNQQIRGLALLVAPLPGVNSAGWNVRLGVPGHPAAIAAPANAQGEIILAQNHPWQPLAAGPALGDYMIEMQANENPGLVENGVLKLDKVSNLVLILEYGFTPA